MTGKKLSKYLQLGLWRLIVLIEKNIQHPALWHQSHHMGIPGGESLTSATVATW